MKGGNENHPKKGSKIKVSPIMDIEAISAIKTMLKDKPMHLALFIVGINTALRASDLVRLTVGQVRYIQPMGDVELRQKKRGKIRRVTLNNACTEAILGLLGAIPMNDEDRLFPLTVPSVHRLVKGWCRKMELRGNYGSHTLRKTFGFIQRVIFKVGLPELTELFGHASQKQTLEYLCIQPEEIRNIYANEI